MTALLDMRDLVVRHGAAIAVDHASMEVHAGEVVALVGANGAGKTSLLNAIAGIAGRAVGTILLSGEPLTGLPAWARARRGVGVSPEGRRIFPGLDVRENLIVGAGRDAHATDRLMAEVFDLFPSLRERSNTQGWQLSGGQQQMLAIGRAIMRQPRLLLLDEPTLGLAPNLVGEVLRTARQIASADRAVLIADQNAAALLQIADRAYAMQSGRIVAQGTAEEIRASPAVLAAFPGN